MNADTCNISRRCALNYKQNGEKIIVVHGSECQTVPECFSSLGCLNYEPHHFI